MRQRTMMAMGLWAGVLIAPAWAQQDTPAQPQAPYREPLSAAVRTQTPSAPAANSRASLPTFSVQPTTAQRVSHNAMTFAALTAVSAASEKQGSYPPPASAPTQPYRPDMSVPEPATAERLCPPLGSRNMPAACNSDAIVTMERNGPGVAVKP
ncbi:hypothetical protein [Dyella japonica]|nr:hypothetical protein [Dyella japonica]